ncbi:Protein of unknown function [Streptomyces sp. DvalAA-14]|uniref:DUF742 domain-containing protein n=1 Tax=unclassified Streptomyces TaxID=2593676 RepID=UPI00081B3947|nr:MULTISPECIES: DUF742 domain-containing protein [unclassified Streptomyces]MYS23136.1 DUF742 domain-containing protein [Streptomyces sp. SID4948]SCE28095.1 Protein of unknown function [Streptomyces sp. DvalAA-14]
MTSESDRWYDDAAGPVVRPYAMTRGRTSHAAEAKIDLIALVVSGSMVGDDKAVNDQSLSPEHLDIVERCQLQATSVAELAADLDLPVGVVRVLVGDLLEGEHVHIHKPVPPAELPDERILREVINGLRAL